MPGQVGRGTADRIESPCIPAPELVARKNQKVARIQEVTGDAPDLVARLAKHPSFVESFSGDVLRQISEFLPAGEKLILFSVTR